LIRWVSRTILLALCLPVASTFSWAQVLKNDLPDLQKVDVQEHLGRQIPLDLIFTDTDGKTVKLGDYFHQGKPVLLSLFYSTCPMLCHVVLQGVAQGVRKLDWNPGDQFTMLSVSFDPRDTLEVVTGIKTQTVALLKPGADKQSWSFLFGPAEYSKRLADSLGFVYYYQADKGQWAHPAVLFVLTEDGIVSRYLYGVSFKEKDLRLALLEASQGKIGNTVDRILLYCYHYDPSAGGYVALAANIMKLGGIATLLILALILGIFWAKEHARKTATRLP
jgi:protein SCO1